MSWWKRVPSSARDMAFHVERAVREGFDPSKKPYVESDPMYRLAKMVLAHPVSYEGFHYSNLAEYTGDILGSVDMAADRYGWEDVADLLILARKIGLSKDPPLVATHKLPSWGMASRVLELYPVKKLHLYLHIARNQRNMGVWLGYGARKRKAVNAVLTSKGYEWNEYQAIKYPRHYRELLRMSHPRPPSAELANLWGWLVGKSSPPTDRVEAYVRIVRGDVRGEDAVQLALEHGFPWEVVRSRANVKLSGVDPSIVLEAARRLMSPWDVAMQASSLASVLGEDMVVELVRGKRVPASAAARAVFGLYDAGLFHLSEVFLEKAREASERTWGIVRQMGGGGEVHYLVDMSGSMHGHGAKTTSIIIAGTGASRVYGFNGCMDVKEFDVSTLSGLASFYTMDRECGTPLYDAIVHMIENVMNPGDTLVVITDEMENMSEASIQTVAYKLDKRNMWLAIVNVAPYPVDMIPKQPYPRAVGLPGSTPDAVYAATAVLSLTKKQMEGVVASDLLKSLYKIVKQETTSEE